MQTRRERPIPVFRLYGETAETTVPSFVHAERIGTSAALHDWEIAPHRHGAPVAEDQMFQRAAAITGDGWKAFLRDGQDAASLFIRVAVIEDPKLQPGHILLNDGSVGAAAEEG